MRATQNHEQVRGILRAATHKPSSKSTPKVSKLGCWFGGFVRTTNYNPEHSLETLEDLEKVPAHGCQCTTGALELDTADDFGML